MVYCGKASLGCSGCRKRRIKVCSASSRPERCPRALCEHTWVTTPPRSRTTKNCTDMSLVGEQHCPPAVYVFGIASVLAGMPTIPPPSPLHRQRSRGSGRSGDPRSAKLPPYVLEGLLPCYRERQRVSRQQSRQNKAAANKMASHLRSGGSDTGPALHTQSTSISTS